MSALVQEEAQARPRRVQAGERRAGRRLPGLEPGRVEAGAGSEPQPARRGGMERYTGSDCRKEEDGEETVTQEHAANYTQKQPKIA